jgi:hypothetical protein
MINLLLPKYRRGDLVRVLCVPPAIERHMPEAMVKLICRAIGKTLRVEGVRSGLLMFRVHHDGSQAEDSSHYTFFLEPQFVEPAV